jgi:transposase-like protein
MMQRSKQAAIELKFGKSLKGLLPELMEQHGSVSAIADALGVSQGTVSVWLKICGLKIKTIIVPEGERQQC